ncbi:hypothetical protein MJO28_014930 [Puccinia striiformis f. sp. tritici]|uniref:EKC/KEOPS complex subunit CGI121 n=3 Tax=Puccinia striiformis TaxID=27350 RepID=A0A0L0VE77_9BASI|nr:hypothetical protein Pst134EB_028357 [Puccinia striiformis f. sp. tritici]KAI7938010.1 hypothetical protein MJO28_014930 [Puccinia striiformis f. sp. tritici]KAI9608103.1 hypothetical protein H4Q26_005558 [Puccinia striiformis f. sp. tritici PST-130]KNE97580.1 hypothetical protein PSTG_09128 [Puccinia striiformis f. sp. tritici PST-78]POV99618.1 hypothetical protein PSHT_13463 [Puccinia striiformis]
MERFELEFFSSVINVWLFEEVKNANEIKKALIQASQTNDRSEQDRLDWAFIDASMITSRQHLITAVSQALVTRSHGTLKTKTLHSEILWTLSPGTNIMEAIKKFGLGPQTSALLLVKLQPIQAEPDSLSNEGLDQAARALVDGNLVSLDHLGKSIVNWKELRRMYKINDDLVIKELERKSKTTAGDLELHAMIDKIVTSTVALKSVAA